MRFNAPDKSLLPFNKLASFKVPADSLRSRDYVIKTINDVVLYRPGNWPVVRVRSLTFSSPIQPTAIAVNVGGEVGVGVGGVIVKS